MGLIAPAEVISEINRRELAFPWPSQLREYIKILGMTAINKVALNSLITAEQLFTQDPELLSNQPEIKHPDPQVVARDKAGKIIDYHKNWQRFTTAKLPKAALTADVGIRINNAEHHKLVRSLIAQFGADETKEILANLHSGVLDERAAHVLNQGKLEAIKLFCEQAPSIAWTVAHALVSTDDEYDNTTGVTIECTLDPLSEGFIEDEFQFDAPNVLLRNSRLDVIQIAQQQRRPLEAVTFKDGEEIDRQPIQYVFAYLLIVGCVALPPILEALTKETKKGTTSQIPDITSWKV